ncbi:MAG: deoxyguanosinetriphosphate triphosphohydrolase [Austwickia sp.]|jgi:dGTPase|nr:deoxyguanosinetriphosphate triphosphohydrolase [Austwickia sp.]MBK8435138.1 deoxyguanosinetriphosphate triphosphohydrolase [Austwickia sp.]MBK9101308.1 deoxyguanosinetriphosphate triphosphohydrolase [Austwickia sp.]
MPDPDGRPRGLGWPAKCPSQPGPYHGTVTGYSPADRQRWVAEDPATKSADRDDFARDRARLVHSAALRRTASKTQVMQPDTDDFVRNRLTHSLEVAQIGRELGAALGCNADVVDTACLAHDIGHPPFGHNGEAALHALAGDIGGFEGNAQTLRLLTRLEAKRFHPDGRSAGLNLTRASLDAVLKYPWGAASAPLGGGKFGVYDQDRDVFEWIRSEAVPGRRCVEAQVMDWADDIGYSVHDVEDAVAGGLLDLRVMTSATDLAPAFDVARRWYNPSLDDDALGAATDRLLRTGVMVTRYDGSRPALAALKDMTSALIGRFARAAEVATRQRYGGGRLTRYGAELVVPESTRTECVVLKSLAAAFVMLTPARQRIRHQEREVIQILHAAYAADAQGRLDPVHLGDYLAADEAGRRRVVIDQVASLSDVRAQTLARRWGGSDSP